MTRDFYFFGRAFLGLAAFCSLLQAIIFFFVGSGFGHSLQVFAVWFLVATLVHLASTVFVLKYFFYKRYLPAFAAGIPVVIATIFQAVVVFSINLLMEYYLPAGYLLVGTSLVSSLTMIFSRTREKVWVKGAGLILLAACLLYTAAFIVIETSPRMLANGVVLRLSQWASLIGSFVPIAYIMNFLDEEKTFKDEHVDNPRSKLADNIISIAFFAAFIASVVFGFKLAAQSTRHGVITLQANMMSKQFEARTYISANGESMSYRLLRPLDYDSTRRYPLAVCLHGGAGWGTDNVKQFDGSLEAQILYSPENRKKYPAFLFVPQCAPGTSWGGIHGLRSVDSLVFEIIGSLEREFSIDKHRRYVMGHSLGGYGAWYFICTRPEMFAAAIPSAGFGDPSFGERIARVPVWAFHGRLDRNVSVNGSRDIIEAMRQAGGNPRYTEYPNVGHGTWEPMKNNPELMDWLFAQKRE
jgi:poly(3-hydroxybutyrate) depolymerase